LTILWRTKVAKFGTITVQLEYPFKDDVSNSTIKQALQNVELPSGYVEDTFEYVGIWNTTKAEWEDT